MHARITPKGPPTGARPQKRERMAYLRRPKNSRNWHIVYHVAGQRREWSTKTTNHGIAKQILKKWEYDRVVGLDSRPTETPVAEVLEQFAGHLRQRTGRTRKKGPQTDLYRLATWFGPVCEALNTNPQQDGRTRPKQGRRIKKSDPRYVEPLRVVLVEEITTDAVATWLANMATRRKLNGKTCNEYREVLSRFVAWAMRRGVRMPGNVNPVAAVDRYRIELKPIRFLTLDQIAEQLNALDGHPVLRTMVATLIYAGLRLGELLWLTPRDVDLQRGYLAVRRKTVLARTWMPKTGKDRAVPISAALHEILETYEPPADELWYFVTKHGCQWDSDAFGDALRTANRAAGLPWTALDFRHTFGSQLAMQGQSLFKIAELLGNSPQVCQRHYAALLPESLVGCVEFPRPQRVETTDGKREPAAIARDTERAARLGLRVIGID